MSTFIVDVAGARIIGYVEDFKSAKEKSGENMIVASATDLEILSNQQLTKIYNGVTGESKGVFRSSKADNAKKVFEAINAKDLADLVQLDRVEEVKVEEQAKNLEEQAVQAEVQNAKDNGQAPEPKTRKVRDSKLQRMKACFLEKNDNGSYKTWTIKELMERCSKPDDTMSERIAHVYISILRSPTDRFIMPISKDKEKGTFVYTPNEQPT